MTIISLIALLIFGIMIQITIFRRNFAKNILYSCYFTVEECFENDELYFIEIIQNKGMAPIPWLRVEINSSKYLEFANSNSVIAQDKRYITSNFGLKSFQQVKRKWKLKCTKRGVYNVNRITLISGDLFGLERFSKPVKVEADLVVLPQRIEFKNIFYPQNYRNDINYIKRWIIEDPFTYIGSREYIPGDPINHVDWKSSAKTGKIIIRKRDNTTKDEVVVYLNIKSQELEYFGTIDTPIIELCIKYVGTVIAEVFDRKIALRLITNGQLNEEQENQPITPYFKSAAGFSKSHIHFLYRVLAHLKFKSYIDLIKLLEETWYEKNNAYVLIVTAYLNQDIVNCLIKLNKNKGNKILIILANSDDCDIDLKGLKLFHFNAEFIKKYKIKKILK